MSKAFDEWWREPFEPSEGKPADIRDLCQRTWNAAIEAAAKRMESYCGVNGKCASYLEIIADVRALAAEEK